MKPPSTGRFISASSNFTMLALVALDILGVLVIFNINHWLNWRLPIHGRHYTRFVLAIRAVSRKCPLTVIQAYQQHQD